MPRLPMHPTHVVDAITVYTKPCGCFGGLNQGNNFLLHGVRNYRYGKSVDHELIECRVCGAVWTLADLFGDWR